MFVYILDIDTESVDEVLPLYNMKGETLKKIVEYCNYHFLHPIPVALKEEYRTDDISDWVLSIATHKM